MGDLIPVLCVCLSCTFIFRCLEVETESALPKKDDHLVPSYLVLQKYIYILQLIFRRDSSLEITFLSRFSKIFAPDLLYNLMSLVCF